MVEVAPDITIDDFPAGFEGYLFNNYATSVTCGTMQVLLLRFSIKPNIMTMKESEKYI